MEVAVLTNHAVDRAKERLGLKKRSLQRLADKALSEGLAYRDCKGAIRKYMGYLSKTYRANNIRLYGENLFAFKDTTLITVYRLENRYAKRMRHQ